MSKKKRKLDKKLIAERLRELETEARVAKPNKTVAPLAATPQKEEKIEEKTTDEQPNEGDRFIVRDMKKVAILTVAIIAVFVVLYFVNLKTNLILKTSDKIFNLLHVGQL